MDYELYADILFLENLVMDYLLLLLLRELLHCTVSKVRIFAAALLGSAAACVLTVLRLSETPFGFLLIYLFLSTGMVYLGLGIRNKRRLLQAVILLYASAWMLGGIFNWLSGTFHFPVFTFLLLSLLSYGLLVFVSRCLLSYRNRGKVLYPVTLSFQGVSRNATGLLDTGNLLRDPYCQKPVSIVSPELVQDLLDQEKLRYIPYHTVGGKGGLMPVFTADFLCIQTEHGEKRIVSPVFGVAKEPLSETGDYDVILNSEEMNV